MTQLDPSGYPRYEAAVHYARLEDRAHPFPLVPDITLNVNNRNSSTHPSGFYDAHMRMSAANVLLRLEKAGCEVWSIAFNGNTLDVTVNAYYPYWFDKFNDNE